MTDLLSRLYVWCHDVYYEIVLSLSWQDILSLILVNHLQYDLLLKGKHRFIWRDLWKRNLSQVEVPEPMSRRCYIRTKSMVEFDIGKAYIYGYEQVVQAHYSISLPLEDQLRYMRNAITENCPHVMQILLKRGFSLHRSNDKLSRCAIKSGNVECLFLLIQDGASLRYKDRDLMAVGRNAHWEMVKSLVVLGADITFGEYGVVELAVETNNFEMTQYLMERSTVDPLDYLLTACSEGFPEITGYILSRRLPSDINPYVNAAIVNGRLDVVKLLDTFPFKRNFSSELFLSITKNQLPLVRYYLEREPSLLRPGLLELTVATSANLDLLAYLLDQGLSIHDIPLDAVNLLIEHGNWGTLSFLLQRGYRIPPREGEIVLDRVLSRIHRYRYFIERDPILRDIVVALIKQGVSIGKSSAELMSLPIEYYFDPIMTEILNRHNTLNDLVTLYFIILFNRRSQYKQPIEEQLSQYPPENVSSHLAAGCIILALVFTLAGERPRL